VNQNYRISGHESFPCRYTWLPKAVQGLSRDPRLFADEEQAMVALGVGKNMVRSIRFWSQVSGMVAATARGAGHAPTELGRLILGDGGLDPYLEDIRTLWLIHWNLSTHVEAPLLAWDYLLNHWQETDLVPSRALNALQKAALMQDEKLSRVTLEQHLETFLHTYTPTRGRKGEVQEDNLDCPLVELELITKVGERENEGRREPVYNFRRDAKPDISPELFAYCLCDFWQKRHADDETLAFREVAHGRGSPGQIFKLPEDDIRERVERLRQQTGGFLSFFESSNTQQVRRAERRDTIQLLREVYAVEVAYA
jgi:hypothetical protein